MHDESGPALELDAEPGDDHLDPEGLHVDPDEADLPAGLAGPAVPDDPLPNPELNAARVAFFTGAKQGLALLITGAAKSGSSPDALWQISDLAQQMKQMGLSMSTGRPVRIVGGAPRAEEGSVNPNIEAAAEHFTDGAHRALDALLEGFDTDNAMGTLEAISMFASQAAEVSEGNGQREKKASGNVSAFLNSLPITGRVKTKIMKLLARSGVDVFSAAGTGTVIGGPSMVGAPVIYGGNSFSGYGDNYGDSDESPMQMQQGGAGLELPTVPNGFGGGRETQGVRMLTELIAGIAGMTSGKALEGDINAYRAAIDADLTEEAERIKERIDARIAGQTPGLDAGAIAHTVIKAVNGLTPDEAEGFGATLPIAYQDA